MLKPVLGSQLSLGSHLARGLVGCWLLNEGSGNKVFDLSGNGNTGTVSSGTVWKPGIYGQVLDIDTTVIQPVTLAKEIILTKGTIIIWAKWSGNNNKMLIGKNDVNNNIIISLPTNIRLEDNANTKISYTVPALGTDWHQLAFTNDGTNWRVFVDSIQSPTGAGIMGQMNINTIGNGYNNTTYVWDDDIGMVMIYNRALSASEIALLYRAQFQI